MLYSFISCFTVSLFHFFMFIFFHAALFSGCTLPSCTNFMLRSFQVTPFFHVALFSVLFLFYSCCFFRLYSFCVELFPFYIFLILHLFHVALLYFFHDALYLCCTFFRLHVFLFFFFQKLLLTKSRLGCKLKNYYLRKKILLLGIKFPAQRVKISSNETTLNHQSWKHSKIIGWFCSYCVVIIRDKEEESFHMFENFNLDFN